ncbi:hypothetical protein Tco_0116741 [Tanacetum coccineum]
MGRSKSLTVILSRAWSKDWERPTKDGWIKISVETKRIKEFEVRQNEKRRREDLDILEERREIASIRKAYYKHKLEGYYNKSV